VQHVPAGGVAVPLVGVVAQQPVPPPAVARHVAGYEPPDGVVDPRRRGAELVHVDQPDPPGAGVDVPPEPEALRLPGPAAAPAGGGVPEPAVDRRLRRPEGRDRLPLALVQPVELPAHERGQDAASPVGGGHGDPGDARRRHRGATGHGHLQAVDARGRGDPAVLEQAERAVELRDRRGRLDEGTGGVVAEGLVHGPREPRPLLGGDGTELFGQIGHTQCLPGGSDTTPTTSPYLIDTVPEPVDGEGAGDHSSAMTVVRLPSRGRWAWDARGSNRAVRVSPHADENVVNLSLWRDDICVGTVRLLPDEAASLVTGLTEGLAELADRPESPPPGASGESDRLREMELRLARIEAALAPPTWRGTVAATAARAQDALGSWRPRIRPPGATPSGA
jgi:hypothetical protein